MTGIVRESLFEGIRSAQRHSPSSFAFLGLLLTIAVSAGIFPCVLALPAHSFYEAQEVDAAELEELRGQTADVRPAVFCSCDMSEPTMFLIRPHRGGWQCFEAPGVQPYWVGPTAREHAITYARDCRTAHRHGEIRVLNAAGELEETIAFDERANRMRV